MRKERKVENLEALERKGEEKRGKIIEMEGQMQRIF